MGGNSLMRKVAYHCGVLQHGILKKKKVRKE